jgi:dCMP deaminase
MIMPDEIYIGCMKGAWKARENARCVKMLGTCLRTKDGDIFFGYNGPPLGVGDCLDKHGGCPRENYDSGTHLEKCQAIHAEMRAILYCASTGIAVRGATLYCSFGIPCKDCMKEIIEVGIARLVVTRMTFYDELSKELLEDFKRIGGIVEVLDVIQCPTCYSLNVDGIGYQEFDTYVKCRDCGSNFIVETGVYVGD